MSSSSSQAAATLAAQKQMAARDMVSAAERNDTEGFTRALFESPGPSPAFDIADADFSPALSLSLLYAAHNDNADMIQLLLDLGMAADAKPAREGKFAKSYAGELKWAIEESCTALMVASRRGNLRALMTLLSAPPPLGANVSARDAHSWTALLRASWNGKRDVVEMLVDRGGASVNEVDASGWSGLMRASWNGHAGVVRALLERRANVALADHHGQTALHLAAAGNHADITRALLEAGADPAVRDVRDSTPLAIARARTATQVVVLLERAMGVTPTPTPVAVPVLAPVPAPVPAPKPATDPQTLLADLARNSSTSSTGSVTSRSGRPLPPSPPQPAPAPAIPTDTLPATVAPPASVDIPSPTTVPAAVFVPVAALAVPRARTFYEESEAGDAEPTPATAPAPAPAPGVAEVVADPEPEAEPEAELVAAEVLASPSAVHHTEVEVEAEVDVEAPAVDVQGPPATLPGAFVDHVEQHVEQAAVLAPMVVPEPSLVKTESHKLRAAEEGATASADDTADAAHDDHMEASIMPGSFGGSKAARVDLAPAAVAAEAVPEPEPVPVPAPVPAPDPLPLLALMQSLSSGADLPSDLTAGLASLAESDTVVAAHRAALVAVLRPYVREPFLEPVDPALPVVPPPPESGVSIPAHVESLLEAAEALRANVETLQDEGNRVEDVVRRVEKVALEARNAKEEAEVGVDAKEAERQHTEEAAAGAEKDMDALAASLASRMPTSFDLSSFDGILSTARTATRATLATHMAVVVASLAEYDARAKSLGSLFDAAAFSIDQLSKTHNALHGKTANTLSTLHEFGARAMAYLERLTSLTEQVLTKLRRKRAQIEADAAEAAQMGLAKRHSRLVEKEGAELDMEITEGEKLLKRYMAVKKDLLPGTQELPASEEMAPPASQALTIADSESSAPVGADAEFVSQGGMGSSGISSAVRGGEPRLIQLVVPDSSAGSEAGASLEEGDAEVPREPLMVDLETVPLGSEGEFEEDGQRLGTDYEGSEAEIGSVSDSTFERVEAEDAIPDDEM